jgi:ubiquinone/menaquinone biosynthesis C-methylase UbiE
MVLILRTFDMLRSTFSGTRLVWLVLLTICSVTAAHAQRQTPPAPDAPPAQTEYMGRRIATTMHYLGAQWLVRQTREREERCSLMLANLGVKRGMTICDLGSGNGYYSLQLAQMAGPTGRVLAVDIQPEMLELLRKRAAERGIQNITPILGSPHDPKLPEGQVDLILLVDVYHEFSHPELMLQAMRRALAPDGQIALLEYRAEDPAVPIKPLHKMSKRQILKEYLPNGFRLVREFDGLPWQHMMFFGRDDAAEKQE